MLPVYAENVLKFVRKIDLHKLLLLNRRDAVKQNLNPIKEKWGWALWKKGMQSRKLTDYFGGKAKNFLLKISFQTHLGTFTGNAGSCPKSFSQQWKEKKGES